MPSNNEIVLSSAVLSQCGVAQLPCFLCRATLERKRRSADEGRSDDDLRQELMSAQKRRKEQEALYREREAAEGARSGQDLRETLRKTQNKRGPRGPSSNGR